MSNDRGCSRDDCTHIVTNTWYDGVLGSYCSQLCLSVHERSDFNNIQHHEIEREKGRLERERIFMEVGKKVKPSDTQEGGNHYKKNKIQPIDYIHENNLSYMQGNVIKYITRYKDKNGLEDLKKAKHYIDLLIEREYAESTEGTEELRNVFI